MTVKSLVQLLWIFAAIIGLGSGLAYAYFTSNKVTIQGSTIRTGQAALKLCDGGNSNGWTTSLDLGSSLNSGGLRPGESKDLLPERQIYMASDDGTLHTKVGAGLCTSYLEPASNSNTSFRVVPQLNYTDQQCSEALAQHLKVRFSFDNILTPYKTLAEWAVNDETIEPVLVPGGPIPLIGNMILDPAATEQDSNCAFQLSFIGRQAGV